MPLPPLLHLLNAGHFPILLLVALRSQYHSFTCLAYINTHIMPVTPRAVRRHNAFPSDFLLGLRGRDLKASFIQLSDRLHDFHDETGHGTLIM